MNDFPYRQVHLDFHTYGNVPKVGNRFSKENFQEALKIAHLDSITVFAKCNQGYCYYPTEVGMMHPGLDFDLTAAMIDAAHEIGVRAPVYINAGLSRHRHRRIRSGGRIDLLRKVKGEVRLGEGILPFCA